MLSNLNWGLLIPPFAGYHIFSLKLSNSSSVISEFTTNDPGILSFGYSIAFLGCRVTGADISPAAVPSTTSTWFSILITKSNWKFVNRLEGLLTWLCLKIGLWKFDG